MVLHYLHKNCIQLILVKMAKNIAWACIIVEQIVIYLIIVEELLNSKQKIVRLEQIHYA